MSVFEGRGEKRGECERADLDRSTTTVHASIDKVDEGDHKGKHSPPWRGRPSDVLGQRVHRPYSPPAPAGLFSSMAN